MGRKANYDEKPKRGKGRKSRVQPPPPLPKQLKPEKEDKKLSRNQLKRLKKRQLKGQQLKDGKKAPKRPAPRSDDSEAESDNSEVGLEEEEGSDVMDDSMEDLDTKTRGYTDDNSNWLKPKAQKKSEPTGKKALFDDSDEDEGVMDDDFTMASDGDEDQEVDEDDEGDSSDDEEMDVERQSKKLLKRSREDAELEKAELKDAQEQDGEFTDDLRLPTAEEVALEQERPPDLATIQQRFKDILHVLADFAHRGQAGQSRREYLAQLSRDFCTYYSYNEFLMERLMQLFAPAELAEFLEANQVQRPLTIRTNTLKTRRRELAQALLNRGVNLDPVGEWSREGLVIYNSQVPIGATPEYLAGHYMLQGAASMLPVLALAPREGEKVLDLCAAPGGKTAHIGALMKNTGVLFANDAQPDRCKAVIANLHRLGVTNAVVSAVDGRKYSKIMTGFDRVLVDAPCSGSGVMSKDERVKTSKDAKDILRCAHLQRELLLTAIDCVDAASPSGGCVVYSTCSVLPEENECVVAYALKHRHVELVDTGLKFGRTGLPRYREHRFVPQMNLTKRFYPHTHNMEGFFVAKLRKISNGPVTTGIVTKEASASEELTAKGSKTPATSQKKLPKGKKPIRAQQGNAEGRTNSKNPSGKSKQLQKSKNVKSNSNPTENGKPSSQPKGKRSNAAKVSKSTPIKKATANGKSPKKTFEKKTALGIKKKALNPPSVAKKSLKRRREAVE